MIVKCRITLADMEWTNVNIFYFPDSKHRNYFHRRIRALVPGNFSSGTINSLRPTLKSSWHNKSNVGRNCCTMSV